MSRLIYRILVNSVIRTHSVEKIKNFIDDMSKIDKKFAQKIIDNVNKINEINVSDVIKDRMIIRLYVYELIESNRITMQHVLEYDPDLVLPSDEIIKLFERIMDPDETILSLFEKYIV